MSEQPRQLLTLPLEIRREIYAHTLTRYRDEDPILPLEGDCASAQLLRTCSQVYIEALPFLYSENTFELRDRSGYFRQDEDIMSWLEEIGERNRDLLRDVELNFDFATLGLSGRWDGGGGGGALDGWRIARDMAEEDGNAMMVEAYDRIRDELELGNEEYMERTIIYLAENCRGIRRLSVVLPGSCAMEPRYGSPWPAEWFVGEVLGTNIGIHLALWKIQGVKWLRLGNTADLDRVEGLAGSMGVDQVEAVWEEADRRAFEEKTNMEGGRMDIIQARWRANGWVIDAKRAVMDFKASPPRELDHIS